MPQVLWMVEAAFPFTSLTANGFECRSEPGEPTHFCPVFLDKEAAEKWADGKYPVTRLLRTNPHIGSTLESLYADLGEPLPDPTPQKKPASSKKQRKR